MLITLYYFYFLIFSILVSNSIISKISLFTAIKLAFLFLFGFFQVYMITSIFNSGKIVNTISINNNSINSDESEKL